MFRFLKFKKVSYLITLMIFGVAGVSLAQIDAKVEAKKVVTASTSTKVLEVENKITKEILTVGDFEIVVSSYQNNGVKTIIVTRNRNGAFYDRTEWVGKGEVPDELNWLMGKGEPGSSQKMKEKSYFGVVVKDASETDGGIVVLESVRSGPAFASGIRKGDRITSIGGKKVKDSRSFAELLTQNKADTKVSCRYFRGQSLKIERVLLAKLPKGTGLNLKSIDGGEIIDTRAINRPVAQKKSKTKVASGPKLMPTKSNISLTNFNAIITAGGWLNVSFNAPEDPISIVVFDGKGKEVFHQHLPWFKGNYKQLIKIKPGVEGPFSLVAAQGASVYSKVIK